MAHPDNKRLCRIEGGRFECVAYGDERDATILELKMPDGFPISRRTVIVIEIDEWDAMQSELERLVKLLSANDAI